MKKALVYIVLVGILAFSIYYFFVRKRYMNNLHTKIEIRNYSQDIDGIEKLVNWYYETYHIPAISAAIIENGEVVRYISRGIHSKKDNIPVDENSFYQIASTSKMLTGTICRSLELEGKLDVKRSISDFLGDKLSKETNDKFQKVSLLQVINHRSGLGRSMYAYSEKDIIKALTEVDFEFEPGTKYQYSNFGYALVSLILELETGKTYEELLQEYIVDRYGLDGFETRKDDILVTNLVTPYNKDFRLFEGATPDFGIQVGASGVFSNTKTLAELAILQMNDYAYFDSLKHTSPLILTYPKAEMWSEKHFYGYGFFEFNHDFEELPDIKHRNLEHGGDLDGFATIYDYYPEYKCGIVVNTSSGGKWINEMTWEMNKILVLKYFENKNK